MDEWISVKQRLPSDLEDVLICFERGGWFRRRILVGRYFPSKEGGEWTPGLARKFRITHWMPLPKLPKDSNQ
jgi:hypothetical protein